MAHKQPEKFTKGQDYKGNKNPKHDKGIASTVEKQVEKALDAEKKSTKDAASDNPTNEEEREFIMSLLKVPEKTTVAAATVNKVNLKSILKKAKNNRGWLQLSVAISLLSLTSSKGRDEPLQTDENEMWDPGGDQSQTNLSSSLYSFLMTATVRDINGENDADETSKDFRTELDSHANMPVVGRNCYIISEIGKVSDLKSFYFDQNTMQIKS